MQGGGENYLSAFALLLQATAFQIGLLSALPQLVGTWSQLLSVKVLHRFPHRKILILTGAAGQALCWIPLLLLPLLFPGQGAWLLIACSVAYFAFGHFATPAWTSLLTDMVDPGARGLYFAHRAKVMTVTSFAALCGAGFLLHSAETWEAPWEGFALVFLAVAACRALSIAYVRRVDDSAARSTHAAEVGLLAFLRHEHGADFRNFLLFSGLMHAAALIAGPFFVIFFLRDLHFTYLEYMVWMATGVLGQFLTLKPWGRIGDRFGNKKIMVVTGWLVPFLPMLYLLGTNFYFVAVVNFFGGVVWGGLSLGLQNYVLDTVRAEDRATGVAVWSTVNAVGWFAGAMTGGWLAEVVPAEMSLPGLELHPASNLQFVFFISGALRVLVSLGLLRTFRETRAVEAISRGSFLAELPLVKPIARALRAGVGGPH
jgi:MFS family permease